MSAHLPGPPHRAARLLRSLGRRLDRDSLADDLLIEYREIESRRGRSRASLWYWLQIVGMLPALLMSLHAERVSLFSSHLKTAFRNIRRHKLHTVINLAGLAVSLSCAILLTLFIRHEISFDRFHVNLKRIYKQTTTYHNQDGSSRLRLEKVSVPHGPAMKAHFPEVKRYSRCFPLDFVVRNRGMVTKEIITQVDTDFFEIFSFPFIRGDASTALAGETDLVLTESSARRLFGREDPLGKTLTLSYKLGEEPIKKDFIVTGLLKDAPSNSTVQFDILMNVQSLKMFGFDSLFDMYDAFGFETYIETDHARAIQRGLPAFAQKYYAVALEKYGKRFFRGKQTGHASISFGMMSLEDVRFNRGAHRNVVIILSGIVLLILLVAGINFVTLSIGNAANRAREIGVRKIMGADRRLIRRLFRTESVALTGMSMLLGLLLASLGLPVFNRLTDRSFGLPNIFSPLNLLFFTALAFSIGLFSGLYPSLVLSRFRVVESLKGKLKMGGKNLFTRSLIVVQFVVSITLIICTIIMGQQIRLLIHTDTGFEKEGVLVIPNSQEEKTARDRLLNLLRIRLESSPTIIGVSESSRRMGLEKYMRFRIRAGEEEFEAHNIRVSRDYFKTLGIDIRAGRDFSIEMPTDSSSAIVNECFARRLGEARCIGKTLDEGTFKYHPLTIIGVVRDYHLRSLHHEMSPVIHYLPAIEARDTASFIYVRISRQNIPAAMDLIRSAWKNLQPERPFQYSFLDEDLDARYSEEKRWGSIVLFSSVFAILISCMGIFGLTAISFSRRIKEVGIRKILGASVKGMMIHLSRDLVAWVVLANILAWPAAYWAMTRWLQGYASRVQVTLRPFLLSAAAALLLALLTTSYQIVKTSRADPVEALRCE